MTKKAKAQNKKTGGLTFEQALIGIVVGSVVLIGAILAYNASSNSDNLVEIEGLEEITNVVANHDDNVSYGDVDLPPTGGIHSSSWQNCGIYDQPVDMPNAVHSLEHGAVWVTYDPALPADDVSALRDAMRGSSHRLLSPFPGLRSPVVAVAWGLRLELDDVNDSRLKDFINNYENGPQTPEPGATCASGVGNPIG